MDKIKHAARSNAWYGNFQDAKDGVRTYNFFGRTRTPSRLGDEENGLRPIVTENDATSPIEEGRRNIANEENGRHAGPQKSNTYNDGYSYEGNEISSAEKATSSDSDNTAQKSKELPQEAGFADETVNTDQQSGKPRRRRFAGIFHKKDSNAATHREKDEKKKNLNSNITVMSQLKAVFLSWINILLIMVPVGIALEYTGVNKIAVFIVNFIAIIPLAALLSYSTEELAMYVGEVLGGLLNASFGNAVELIVGIIALAEGQVVIVQTSLIGSMLSNLLLVMGMCFFCGGINRIEQNFNLTVAQTAASLLALAIGSLIIPTAFAQYEYYPGQNVPQLSRGTAVMLLVVYACYLIFQLRTHKDVYNAPSEKVAKKTSGKKESGDALKAMATTGAASGAATAGGRINQENLVQDVPEDEELPQLTRIGALITLAVSTVFIALCAEYMVSAIGDVTESGGVSEEFVADLHACLILLPIVGNAAEHATAVTVAIKDKMDLAIGVAIGSSLQIALLVLPLMILLNWFGVGDATLTLNFDVWLVVVLVIAIWLVNYLINDGKSHWLEGVMLMITYLIIALAAWFYPNDPNEKVA